jgi:hypothetical protein
LWRGPLERWPGTAAPGDVLFPVVSLETLGRKPTGLRFTAGVDSPGPRSHHAVTPYDPPALMARVLKPMSGSRIRLPEIRHAVADLLAGRSEPGGADSGAKSVCADRSTHR